MGFSVWPRSPPARCVLRVAGAGPGSPAFGAQASAGPEPGPGRAALGPATRRGRGPASGPLPETRWVWPPVGRLSAPGTLRPGPTSLRTSTPSSVRLLPTAAFPGWHHQAGTHVTRLGLVPCVCKETCVDIQVGVRRMAVPRSHGFGLVIMSCLVSRAKVPSLLGPGSGPLVSPMGTGWPVRAAARCSPEPGDFPLLARSPGCCSLQA